MTRSAQDAGSAAQSQCRRDSFSRRPHVPLQRRVAKCEPESTKPGALSWEPRCLRASADAPLFFSGPRVPNVRRWISARAPSVDSGGAGRVRLSSRQPRCRTPERIGRHLSALVRVLRCKRGEVLGNLNLFLRLLRPGKLAIVFLPVRVAVAEPTTSCEISQFDCTG